MPINIFGNITKLANTPDVSNFVTKNYVAVVQKKKKKKKRENGIGKSV